MTVENAFNVCFCFCKKENSERPKEYILCFFKIKMAIIMGKKKNGMMCIANGVSREEEKAKIYSLG